MQLLRFVVLSVRSINNRYYFDYNATSPLAESVKDWLAKGDFPFANPASIHHSGKTARRHLNEVREFLFSSFNLKESNFDLFFHSGATEGIGNLIRGYFERHEKASFVYIATDHSCVFEHGKYLASKGITVLELQVDQDGQILSESLEKLYNLKGPIFLNWTWVNNETGVVLPLQQVDAIKTRLTDCFVHVDSVQAPGKVSNWNQCHESLDAYTYSSHKFGSLKGVGFTFLRLSSDVAPVIVGGGQQGGRRSGTENSYGVYSIMLALKELIATYDSVRSEQSLSLIKESILSALADGGELVAAAAPFRNSNTLYVVFNHVKSDITSVAFDLAGIDVSTGSACSSGAIVPSRVLLRMGYDEIRAKSAIRFSFAPNITKTQAQEYAQKICEVVKRFSH